MSSINDKNKPDENLFSYEHLEKEIINLSENDLGNLLNLENISNLENAPLNVLEHQEDYDLKKCVPPYVTKPETNLNLHQPTCNDIQSMNELESQSDCEKEEPLRELNLNVEPDIVTVNVKIPCYRVPIPNMPGKYRILSMKASESVRYLQKKQRILAPVVTDYSLAKSSHSGSKKIKLSKFVNSDDPQNTVIHNGKSFSNGSITRLKSQNPAKYVPYIPISKQSVTHLESQQTNQIMTSLPVARYSVTRLEIPNPVQSLTTIHPARQSVTRFESPKAKLPKQSVTLESPITIPICTSLPLENQSVTRLELAQTDNVITCTPFVRRTVTQRNLPRKVRSMPVQYPPSKPVECMITPQRLFLTNGFPLSTSSSSDHQRAVISPIIDKQTPHCFTSTVDISDSPQNSTIISIPSDPNLEDLNRDGTYVTDVDNLILDHLKRRITVVKREDVPTLGTEGSTSIGTGEIPVYRKVKLMQSVESLAKARHWLKENTAVPLVNDAATENDVCRRCWREVKETDSAPTIGGRKMRRVTVKLMPVGFKPSGLVQTLECVPLEVFNAVPVETL